MRLFMISLPDSEARRKAFFKSMVGVLEPNDLTIVDGVLYTEFTKEELTRMVADSKKNTYVDRVMSYGEIGCYAAHLKALRAFVETGEPLGLIFEDDCEFRAPQKTPRIFEAIETAIAQIPDFRFANLGKSFGHARTKKEHHFARTSVKIEDGLNSAFRFYRSFVVPLMATANIWTREAAIEFLADEDLHFTVPYDDAIMVHMSARPGAYIVGEKNIFKSAPYDPQQSIITTINKETSDSRARASSSKLYPDYEKQLELSCVLASTLFEQSPIFAPEVKTAELDLF